MSAMRAAFLISPFFSRLIASSSATWLGIGVKKFVPDAKGGADASARPDKVLVAPHNSAAHTNAIFLIFRLLSVVGVLERFRLQTRQPSSWCCMVGELPSRMRDIRLQIFVNSLLARTWVRAVVVFLGQAVGRCSTDMMPSGVVAQASVLLARIPARTTKSPKRSPACRSRAKR